MDAAAIQHLIDLITPYGYGALFVIVFFEGPIASIVGGMLAAANILNLYLVFWAILISNLLSDVIYYVLGRYGGEPFVRRFGKYIGVTAKKVEALESHARDHGGKTIMLAKLQVVGPLPTGIALLLALGIGKMPFLPYLWWNFIGTIPQTILLEGIGYWAGAWFATAGSRFVERTLIAASVLALAGAMWWAWRKYKKH